MEKMLFKQWLDKCYSDSAPSETTVKRFYADFKRCRTNSTHAERSVRPNSELSRKTPRNSTNSFCPIVN